MIRRRRLALWLGASLTALTIASSTLAWWILATEPGARWGFERLGGILPGELKADKLHGSIRGPLVVEHVAWRTERIEVAIDRLALDWRLRELVRKRLDIRSLHADGVTVKLGVPEQVREEPDSARTTPDLDLPVDIIVHDAVVRDLRIVPPARDTAIVIDRIALESTMFRDTLGITEFTVRSRALDADVRGHVLPHGGYPMDLTVAWTARPPRSAPARGETRLVGTLDTLHVANEIVAPFRSTLDARLTRPFRERRADGTVTFQGLRPRTLNPEWPAGEASGRIAFAGVADRFTANGSVSGATPEWGRVNGDFAVARAGASWTIERLRVGVPGRPTRLDAAGTLETRDGGARFDLRANWRDLLWPLRGDPALRSPRGSARLAGSTDGYRYQVEALLAGDRVPPGPWRANGTGNTRRARLDRLRGRFLNGELAARGEFGWQGTPRWRLDLAGRGIDPGEAFAGWPGRVDFTAHTRGVMAKAGPVGTVEVPRLAGTLRGKPLDAGGSVALRGGVERVMNAHATLANAKLTADGWVGRRWDLAWTLDAPDLSAVEPRAAGTLAARGRITGPGGAPRLQATIAGDSLTLDRNRIAMLRAEADVGAGAGAGAGAPLRLDVGADRVRLGDRSYERIALRGSGTRADHTIELAARAGADSLAVALAGGLARDTWSGRLGRLDLTSRAAGVWTLAQPAPLTLSAAQLELRDFAWRSGDGVIRSEVAWHKAGPWNVDATLENLKLALFEPLFPASARIRGPLAGEIHAAGQDNAIARADVRLEPGPGTIAWQGANGAWDSTAFDRGLLSARSTGAGVEGNLTLNLPQAGSVQGEGRLPGLRRIGPPAAAQPVEGRLQAKFDNLRPVQAFVPDLTDVQGRFDADLRVAGTFGDPQIAGQAQLAGAQADVPAYGLQLREVALQASGDSRGRLKVDGGLRSGPGRMTVTGEADLGHGGRPQAQVALKGDRVQASNTSELKMLVSPDLQAKLSGNRVDLTGQVIVPQARVELKKRERETLLLPSGDVVFVGEGADTTHPTPLKIYSQVRLVVGDDVQVTGMGLRARPSGSVLAFSEPDGPPRGTGELQVKDGTYSAYGVDLAIERGRLIFGGGPLNDPGLDVRAARSAEGGVVAGFEVRGTLLKPELTVFSTPSMSQSEALSYVLFGQPLGSVGLNEGRFVNNAANMLGSRGGNALFGQFAQQVGIENARLETSGGFGSTSVFLGTHVSPKLYVSYGFGLFDPATIVRLQYLLNRRWTLQVETAEENRADVLYNVERR